MSRPANPSWTIPIFAPNANYPAGSDPWSGTPTKTTHPGASSVGITPDTGVAAQVINKVLNDAYATDDSAKAYLQTVIDFVGQAQALNFGPPVGSIGTPRRAVWSDGERIWWVIGDSGQVRRSTDYGRSFGANETGGVTAGTEECGGIDVDASGNAVVALNVTSKTYLRYTAGGAWASGSLPAGWTASGTVTARVVYNPVAGLWCLTHCDTFNSRTITSPDRSTWTNRFQWSVGGNPHALMRVGVNKTSGRMVFAGHDVLGSGTLNIATSDDGGITLTNRATLTTTIASPTHLDVVYNPDRSEWLAVIGKVTGGPASEVWRSTDAGVSWTKVATLATACIQNPAPCGSMWVGSAALGSPVEAAYSLDGGATWKGTGYARSANGRGCFAGAGGLLLLDSSAASPSFRAGTFGATLT